LRRLWREYAFAAAGASCSTPSSVAAELDRFFEHGWRAAAPAIRIEQARVLADADGFTAGAVAKRACHHSAALRETVDGTEAHSSS
jgi:hypothetical protein